MRIGLLGASGSNNTQLTLAGIESYITPGDAVSMTYVNNLATDMFIDKRYTNFYYASEGKIYQHIISDPSTKHIVDNISVTADNVTADLNIEFFQISDDGSRVFIKEVGYPDIYYVRELATAWDISTIAAVTQTWTLTPALQSSGSFVVVNNGKFLMHLAYGEVLQKWELASPWDLDIAPSNVQSADLSDYLNIFATQVLTSWAFDYSGKSLFIGLTEIGQQTVFNQPKDMTYIKRFDLTAAFDLATITESAEGAYTIGQQCDSCLRIIFSPNNRSMQVLTSRWYNTQRYVHDFTLDATGPFNTGPCSLAWWQQIDYNNSDGLWVNTENLSFRDDQYTYLAFGGSGSSDWLAGTDFWLPADFTDQNSFDVLPGVTWTNVQMHSFIFGAGTSGDPDLNITTDLVTNVLTSEERDSSVAGSNLYGDGWYLIDSGDTHGWTNQEMAAFINQSPPSYGMRLRIHNTTARFDCIEIGFAYTLP